MSPEWERPTQPLATCSSTNSGGANGELAAAMQYSIQGLNCDDPAIKDMLMDIGTEELSHLEAGGSPARMHLKPMKSMREAAEADPLVAIAGGGAVTLCNSMGKDPLEIGLYCLPPTA